MPSSDAFKASPELSASSPESETEMHWLIGNDVRADIRQECVDRVGNIVYPGIRLSHTPSDVSRIHRREPGLAPP